MSPPLATPMPGGLCTATCTIDFHVRASTSFGDSIVVVGSCAALGQWEPLNSPVRLTTKAEDYPCWKSGPLKVPVPTLAAPVEYKYVRLTQDGQAVWEADGENRVLATALDQHTHHCMVVDDGAFGEVRRDCFSFPASVNSFCPGPTSFPSTAPSSSPRLVILGDAVAAGHRAWCLQGWAQHLASSLSERWGYLCANLASVHSSAGSAAKEFKDCVANLQPSVVVLSFGLDLRHLASCPEWEREGLCKRFMEDLRQLIDMCWDIGAMPVLGAPYPHDDFQEAQSALLRRTQQSLHECGLPVLDWLSSLAAPGNCCTWVEGLSSDSTCPSVEGHRRMLAAIDMAMFDPTAVKAKTTKAAQEMKSAESRQCFADGNGFEISYVAAKRQLIISNKTKNEYQLNGGWAGLNSALQATRREAPWSLKRGVYCCIPQKEDKSAKGFASVALSDSGSICAESRIPPQCTLTLEHVELVQQSCRPGVNVLFSDGNLCILRLQEAFVVINSATCQYNVHPMWQDVRLATRALPQGVYEDEERTPFRTAVISAHGLQSRIKVPATSAIILRRTGPLSSLKRIALLPLGDRCSIRMLLHKIEYDGPCYPFDLTRTTSLADVADMVATGFTEMWNEHLLEYDHEAGRVFHKKWHGLSFAHEVEDGDDPVCNFKQVAERMAKRYGGRAARFDYAARHADSVLFLRTGVASRDEVTNMLARVSSRFPGLHASLLLISDQPSEEFQGLLGVKHVRENFDPDRMYEDMDYWIHSAHRFRGILDDHGINARTLYWCPNNLKEAEKELEEAQAAELAKEPPQRPGQEPGQTLLSREGKFSHSNLYALERAQGA